MTGQDMGNLERAEEDYHLVQQVIAYVSETYQDQPEHEDIARALNVDADRLRRTFRQWAGLTPKAFLQAVTLDHARRLLEDSASILDAAYALGLSGPARLHDLFVSHEAMTPGTFKARGRGLCIAYGFHPSPFGRVLLMATDKGLAGLAFADEGEEETALEDMTSRWPAADFIHDPAQTAPYAARIFDCGRWQPDDPLKIIFIGTDFEIRVWETLLKIPMGRLTTYGDVANHLGKPKAFRAVGTAVGKNPLSFVVPCHRVFGKDGGLHGYHWGLTRKQAMLGWETGMITPAPKP